MTNRIEVFKQMLEADPNNGMVLFGLANEYLKAEDFQNAIVTLENYLTVADDEGAAYGMLAKAYERTGQHGKAKSAYEIGIQVSNAHGHPSMARNNFARRAFDLPRTSKNGFPELFRRSFWPAGRRNLCRAFTHGKSFFRVTFGRNRHSDFERFHVLN
jgi:tetratricopeptide (TPR) repeat protein